MKHIDKTPSVLFMIVSIMAILFVFCGDRIDFIQPDTHGYSYPADSLILLGAFPKDMYRTPGYPLLLCLVKSMPGTIDVALPIIQFGIHVFASLLLYRYVSILCSLLFLLFPAALAYSTIALPDSVFVSLLVCVLILLSRFRPNYSWSIISGLLLGVLVMLKPVAIFFGIVMFFVLCLYTKPKKFAVIMLVCAYILPAVWIARNYCYNNSMTISPVTGGNLCLHFVSRDNLAKISDDSSKDIFSQDKRLRKTALKMMYDQPNDYAKSVLRSIIQMFMPGESTLRLWENFGIPMSITRYGARNAINDMAIVPLLFIIVSRILFLGVFLIAPLYGLATWFRRGDRSLCYCLFVASGLYFVIVVSLSIPAYERLALPLLPSQALLGSFALYSLKSTNILRRLKNGIAN